MTHDISYYLTNQSVDTTQGQEELFQAIRRHWGVESDHWIRDVTFKDWTLDKNSELNQVD